MRNSLKRPVSILLALMLIIGVFTVLPVASAGALADTTNPWLFTVEGTTTSPSSDPKTYNLDGKWVRYGDDDFQLTGEHTFLRYEQSTLFVYLLFGDQTVAQYRRKTSYNDYGNTVYVTGFGTEEHPYVFTPNMVFYKTGGTTFGSGSTVAIGYENTGSNDNGIAVPGDGFKNIARMQIGANNYASFLQHNGSYYQQTITGNASGYVGVKDSKYGLCNNSSKTSYFNSDASWPFEDGNDTLYYLGRSDYEGNNLYTFSETRNIKEDFTGTNKVVCTATWVDSDGTTLRTRTYSIGETPVYEGADPSKSDDAAYHYEFDKFEPDYEPIDDDITYVAKYNITKTGDLTYEVNSRIFSVSDGNTYAELDTKCYRYGGSMHSFPSGGSFSVANDQILLCGQVVADIDVTHTAYKTFAETVYVTGSGSSEDPYEFFPNYIYGDASKTNVKDGTTVAVTGHTGSGDKGVAHPGDGFRGMARIRVGKDTEKLQFMQKLGYYTASRGYVGVGKNTYGYNYNKDKASPFSFVSEDHILYYYEQSEAGKYQFSETKPPLRSSFDDTESQTKTVRWLDEDGTTVLDEETYYVGVMPTYKKSTPAKDKDADYYYTFNGWSPAVSAVTEDAEYTATYTSAPRLFKGNSLTLEGDIGLNFHLALTSDQVTNGSGTVVHFSWTVNGTEKTDDCTIKASDVDANGLYKATCWLPASEMSYQIHATATINGELQSDTDDYSVREYGLKILSNPSVYTPAGKNSADLEKLIKTMLDYGAKAQVQFGRTEVVPANLDFNYEMTEITPETIPAYMTEKAVTDTMTNVGSYGLEYKGTSLVYESKTTLRHYYKVVDDTNLEAYIAKATETNFDYGTKGSFIYFERKNICAAELDDVFTLAFDNNASYRYSPMAYLKKLLELDSITANEKALAAATYWYNDAANTYFGA